MFRGFVNTFSISPFSVLGVGYSRLTVYTVIIRCFRQFVAVLQMRRQLGALAQNDPALADDFFEPYLKVIEQDIHQRQNRVREAMNNTLIAIGSRNSALQEKALAVAEKIGEVYVDHGETACKTPEAVSYIQRQSATSIRLSSGRKKRGSGIEPREDKPWQKARLSKN